MNVVNTIAEYRVEAVSRMMSAKMVLPAEELIVLAVMPKAGEEKREIIINDMIDHLDRNYNINVSPEIATEIFSIGVRKNLREKKMARGSMAGFYKLI